MCVHYVVQNPEAVIAHAKFAADVFDIHGDISTSAWPRAKMPVIVEANGIRKLAAMRWGVRPWYADKYKSELIANARDDSLLTKSIWKTAARQRRCLVPSDGFFEWAGQKGAKYEVFIRLADHAPFFFAGLWSQDGNDEPGYALVTGRPNELVAAIPHDRMPVILSPENAREWLGSKPLTDTQLLHLCAPYPAENMVREVTPKN